MRTHSFLFALIGVATLAFTACEPKNQKKEEPWAPQEFAQKHLIEEFTGQDCGYCPYGMDCIHDFIKNDTNWVVILHHAGYRSDHMTIKENTTIAKKLKVGGAPSMDIDRNATTFGSKSATIFHPMNLANLNSNSYKTKTYASINITNTYDAGSRKLHVKVSGMMGKEDYPALNLSVLVKESGIIDYQADYYNSYEGWKEFRHTNAVRAFLTDALGDALVIDPAKHTYSAEFDIDLDSKWNAENCMVVAFLTEDDFKAVIQANERPVVSGSKGGADIQHGGITAVPVPDYYPEPSATASTKDASGLETDTLNVAEAWGSINGNVIEWQIQAYNLDAAFEYQINGQSYNFIPFVWIYLYTAKDAQAIPAGTYQFTNTAQPGTAYMGFRDDSQFLIGGSTFYYTEINDFKEGYLSSLGKWLIADGTLTITDKGWELNGHARNGSTISLYGSTAIKNNGASNNAPAKKPALMMQNASQPRKMLPIIR